MIRKLGEGGRDKQDFGKIKGLCLDGEGGGRMGYDGIGW